VNLSFVCPNNECEIPENDLLYLKEEQCCPVCNCWLIKSTGQTHIKVCLWSNSVPRFISTVPMVY